MLLKACQCKSLFVMPSHLAVVAAFPYLTTGVSSPPAPKTAADTGKAATDALSELAIDDGKTAATPTAAKEPQRLVDLLASSLHASVNVLLLQPHLPARLEDCSTTRQREFGGRSGV
jgi:hypothetical protein